MMDIIARIRTYEKQLKDRGLSLNTALGLAGVDRSTWTRWKGTPAHPPTLPNLSKWQAIERAMEAMITPSKRDFTATTSPIQQRPKGQQAE